MLQKPAALSSQVKAMVAVDAAAALDGGYAWLVMMSCFMVFGLTFGVIKASGVFYVEINQYFETTATGTSWITSITVATIHSMSHVACALSARYSYRSVVMTGGLISSVGVVIGAFARNPLELYLTVGFLNGFGYAMTWTPTITMLGFYFEKKRPLANAIASAGECVLTFVLTPLFQLLIDSYSWRGALLILGGLQLNLCVCGMLLRPLTASGAKTSASVTAVTAEVKDEEDGRRSRESNSKPSKMEEEAKDHGTLRNSSVSVAQDASKSKSAAKAKLRTKILRYIDFTLITNARFMVYSGFGFFTALGFFAPGLFLVPYAHSKGIEDYRAASLVSIAAALDLFGRLFFGWVANLRLMETVQQLAVTVLLLGLVLLLFPLADSFLDLAAFSGAFGLMYGATVTIHITALAEVVGVNRLGSALGFFMLIRSSGGLVGPPIAGFFIDQVDDYGVGFLMAGVSIIVSSFFLLLLLWMTRKGQRSTPQKTGSSYGQEVAKTPC